MSYYYPASPDPQSQAPTYPARPSVQARRAGSPGSKTPLTTTVILALLAGAGLVIMLCTLAALILGYYTYYQTSGRIIPGVYAGSLPLGNMTVTDAAVLLQKTWNLETRILVYNGSQEQTVSPVELGLSIDPLETALRAYAIGHDRSLPGNLGQMVVSMLEGWQITPVLQYDEAAARLGIESLVPLMSQPAQDAALQLQGDQLAPVPAKLGYTINVEETLDDLSADPLGVLLNGLLVVKLKPEMPRIEDVSAALAEAQRLLDTPLTIWAYDPIKNEQLQWQIGRQEIAAWLMIEPGEAGPQVGIDPQRVGDYLKRLSLELAPERYLDAERFAIPLARAVLRSEPFSINISHAPTTYIIQPGDTLLKIAWRNGMPFWMIQQANPELDPDALWVGAELTIPAKDELLPLPAVPNKRIIIGIDAQRMWIYQDGQQIQEFVISTGIDRSPTQPGIFQVQTHDLEAYASVWDLYMPHFLGIYQAWPGFMNGIHGLPTLSNGRRLWANILGRPASYGCIILDLDDAEWLYNWAEEGVVVEITP